MGFYRCDRCEGCFCSHETTCYESHFSKHGLICEDCHTECGCEKCGEYDNEVRYCKITDQYYHDKCIGV